MNPSAENPIWSMYANAAANSYPRHRRWYGYLILGMRIAVIVGIAIRYAFHYDVLMSTTQGARIILAVIACLFFYATLATLLSFAMRKAEAQKRRHYAGWLCFVDIVFLSIFHSLSLNGQSDLHLSLVVPLATAILEVRVRRLRWIGLLLFIGLALPTTTSIALAQHFRTLSAHLQIDDTSWLKGLFGIFIPRMLFWGLMAMPMLAQEKENDRRARDSERLAKQEKKRREENLKLAAALKDESTQTAVLFDRLKEALVENEEVQALSRLYETQNNEIRDLAQSNADAACFWQTLMDELPYAVFWKGPDCRLRYVDRKLATDLGYEMEYLFGKNDRDIFGENDPRVAEYEKSDRETLDGPKGRVERHEPHYAGRTAAHFDWIHTTKVRLKNLNGEPLGLIGICREANREVEAEFYERVHKASGLCLFWKNAIGQFVNVNDMFVASTGLVREQILGKTDSELYDRFGSEFAAYFNKIDLDLQERRLLNYDKVELHPFGNRDGAKRWVRCIKVALLTDQDAPIGIQGAFLDIQDASEENERFIQWFLHDANKPIALINRSFLTDIWDAARKWCDIAASTKDTVEINAQEMYQDMDSCLRAVLDTKTAIDFLSTQFFAFGVLRNEWSKHGYSRQYEEVNLEEKVACLKPLIQAQAGNDEIKLHIPTELHTVFGDECVLRAAFWIMMDNAVKKHKERRQQMIDEAQKWPPEIGLEVLKKAKNWKGTINARYERRGTFLYFIVEDEGIGATLEECEEYSSTQDTNTRGKKFGSQILRYFSRELGGNISLTSKGRHCGAKAEFWITENTNTTDT